jgi:hypothetical protein
MLLTSILIDVDTQHQLTTIVKSYYTIGLAVFLTTASPALAAPYIVVQPDAVIQIEKAVPEHRLCATLRDRQKRVTNTEARITNYQPCTLELNTGKGVWVLHGRIARLWLYKK